MVPKATNIPPRTKPVARLVASSSSSSGFVFLIIVAASATLPLIREEMLSPILAPIALPNASDFIEFINPAIEPIAV